MLVWNEGSSVWCLCRTAAVTGTACAQADEGVQLCSVGAGGKEWQCGVKRQRGPEDAAGCAVVERAVDSVVIEVAVLEHVACI